MCSNQLHLGKVRPIVIVLQENCNTIIFAENFTLMKNWNELSIKDKNDIIKVAVRNGITTLPEIRERYNEFAEGGPEETIEKVLPEVVVKPSEKDKNSLAKMIRMLPDAKSREDMYYEIDPWSVDEPLKISQNESIDRLYNIYKLSGYPDVSSHRTIRNYLEYPFSKWLDRPIYNPITNTMHLPNSEEAKYDAAGFIPELAHAYQFHGDKTGFLDFLKNAFHLPGDIKINGKSGYERPGHMEHTAHSIIEPAIYDYVQGYTDSFNPSLYASGGKIHIKKENRGKFTALKKRTGHSASWFKAHGTPAQRKMATFELNARKWKHGDGGHLYDGESEDTQQMYTGFDWWNRTPMTDYMDIAYEPIPDNAPKSKGTPLLDTPIMVQTTPTASTAATFGQYMPKYESTPKRELITLGATVAAPFLSSVGQYGLQAMNTAFTPSTWLNPVTGAKLLSPTVGTIADAGIQGAFAYEGLNGLWNQGKQGTLLSDPANTFMHGLEVLPVVGLGSKAIGSAYRNLANSNIVKNRGFALPINNTLYWVGKGLGSEISLTPGTEGYMRVSDVLSKSPGTGRKLYDAAIKYAQNNGYRGIESGNMLLSAPKTYRIWEHYPNRQLLGNYGTHNNFNMASYGELDNVGSVEDMVANTANGIPTKFEGAPVYGLTEPSVETVIRAKRAYSTPKADIMPVEGKITTSDIPVITPENAASMTPEQWTAAQDLAIARGDMTEAQRLRDLHSTLTPTATSGKYYRGTKTKRNSYIDRHIDEEVGEMNGIYMTKKPKYAKTYGDVEEFYLHSNNPLETEGNWTGVINDATRAEIENAGYDAIVNNKFDTGFLNRLLRNSRDETITFSGKNIKLADAVTFDNNGVRIPLGDRDNFSNPDIRLGWLPWILGVGAGTAGYSHLNQDQGPLVEYAMGGRLNGK